MNRLYTSVILLLLLFTTLFSCKKDDPINQSQSETLNAKGKIQLQFTAIQ